MAAEHDRSGQVPPQPTIRRVFGMMKAYLNEFERQTLSGFKTLREQYEEKDQELTRAIWTVMGAYDANSSPTESADQEEKLHSLLSQRMSFRAEHNEGNEEEACEKRQMELLRPLQIALFHSFPLGSWEGIVHHKAEDVQGHTGPEEQHRDKRIEHSAQETQKTFETVDDVEMDGGASPDDVNGGIHGEEPCDGVPSQIAHKEVAESNEVQPVAISSSRTNEHDAEARQPSVKEADDSELSSLDLDSEFDPQAEENSEEVDDEITPSARVDEKHLVTGTKRKLSYAGRFQRRKKPFQREKPPTKNQSKERTIGYREVYDNTISGHKETIVQYPANKGPWYIIRCDEHGLRFGGSNPLMDAACHLGSLQHDKYSKAYKDVIEKMGVRVKYCSAKRAEQNNNASISEAVQKSSPRSMDRTTGRNDEEKWDGQALASQKETLMSDRTGSSRRNRDTEDPFCDDMGYATSDYHDNNESNEKSYVHRQPGDICLVYFGKLGMPVLVLPFDNMLEIGINGDLSTLHLAHSMPDCCFYDPVAGEHRWERGYEDGGAFESLRSHPCLGLTRDTLEMCPPLWVKGTDLGEFDLTDPMIMRQEYYQPLLRLIQQANVNRSASTESALTEPGSQRARCLDADDQYGPKGCTSLRADGKATGSDQASEQGGDAEQRPQDRLETQDDDHAKNKTIQDNGLSEASDMSLLALPRHGNRSSEPHQEIEANRYRCPRPEGSHDPSQQSTSNYTSALSDDLTMQDSFLTSGTTVLHEATACESYIRHEDSGDKPKVVPSTEKRSQSPPPIIMRAVSVQTISSDSSDEGDQILIGVAHGNPDALTAPAISRKSKLRLSNLPQGDFQPKQEDYIYLTPLHQTKLLEAKPCQRLGESLVNEE
ncbi:unnamed protein product [Clonostachys rosea]|uniref:Uncharacterized protein n=1 Tax=Bionectria ochroleuca TaxID=29856 RepID=A0ABY6UKP7_BIOOC|nr:unnamed protein product [Clonostachys rosea]